MRESGESVSRLAKLGFIDLFPIFLGRPSSKLTSSQNEELFSMLSVLGSNYAQVNAVVAFITWVTILCISQVLDSNIHTGIWLSMHSLVLLTTIVVQTLARRSQKQGTFTLKNMLVGS